MRPENSPPPWSEARGARRQAVAFAHDPIDPAALWVQPIRNSIDMLATGINSPVGIKVAGADLATIDMLTTQIEAAGKTVLGVSWLVWALGHSISVATAVGFGALAGVAAEFGVEMPVYLKNDSRDG